MTKNAEEVGVISTLLIIPMTLLGGAFWPRWVMPELLQELGKFVPQHGH